LVGDWVLKNVIYTCKELVEEGMFIGRLGGEEFGIAIHNVSEEQMFHKIETLRLAIEKLDTATSGVSLQVTASFGISHSSTSGYDLSMLFTHADLALFRAKNKGRNQTVVYHPNMTSE
jgi:diguanylate cyclase (GGDEF)-like protein